jgi:hypothetical protein
MASGDFLFFLTARNVVPDDTNPQTPDVIAIDSNSQEEVWDGDGGADEGFTLVFGWPTNYDGGGVDVQIGYSTDGTSTGTVEHDLQFLSIGDTENISTKSFNGTTTTITDTPSTATANIVDVTAATSITHAVCDSPAAGDKGFIKYTRTGSTDGNTNDSQFHWLYATET